MWYDFYSLADSLYFLSSSKLKEIKDCFVPDQEVSDLSMQEEQPFDCLLDWRLTGLVLVQYHLRIAFLRRF